MAFEAQQVAFEAQQAVFEAHQVFIMMVLL
jgi:hypothetical protein